MATPLSLSIRLSSWQHRTARGLLKNGCCNATTAPTAVLPGDSRATPFPLFLLSCLWLIVAFCCPSRQQGTVRELLEYGCCNAATAPAAVLPGDRRGTPFFLFALQLPPVICCIPFVILRNKAQQGGFSKYGCGNATTAPAAVLPGDSKAMPFFIFLMQLPPVNC